MNASPGCVERSTPAVICFSACPETVPQGRQNQICPNRYFREKPTYRLPPTVRPQTGGLGYKRRQSDAGGAAPAIAVYQFLPRPPGLGYVWRAGPAGLAVVTTETPVLAGRISNLIRETNLSCTQPK